jgi:hypothetical protein
LKYPKFAQGNLIMWKFLKGLYQQELTESWRFCTLRTHTERQWEGKFFKCGMRCYYCYAPLTLLDATKEHKTPRSRGGADTIDNIVPACITCNDRKGDMTEEEFRAAFHKAFAILTRDSPAESIVNFSIIDAPSVEALRKESESVSWAWRNAPPEPVRKRIA